MSTTPINLQTQILFLFFSGIATTNDYKAKLSSDINIIDITHPYIGIYYNNIDGKGTHCQPKTSVKKTLILMKPVGFFFSP